MGPCALGARSRSLSGVARSWLLPGPTGHYQLGPLIPLIFRRALSDHTNCKINTSSHGWVGLWLQILRSDSFTSQCPGQNRRSFWSYVPVSVIFGPPLVEDRAHFGFWLYTGLWVWICHLTLAYKIISWPTYPVKFKAVPHRAAIPAGLGCSLPYHSIFFLLLLLLLSHVSHVQLWQPHRRQPRRLPRPWDFPGKNTGVGCHFLLQCMEVKSESEVPQSCPTLSDPMDCSPPGSSVHGILQERVLEWVFPPEYFLFPWNLAMHSKELCDILFSIYRIVWGDFSDYLFCWVLRNRSFFLIIKLMSIE